MDWEKIISRQQLQSDRAVELVAETLEEFKWQQASSFEKAQAVIAALCGNDR